MTTNKIKKPISTTERILEYPQGIKALKAFNLTGENFRRLDQTMKQLKSHSLKLEVTAGAPIFLYMGILDTGCMAVPLLGLHMLFLGEISRDTLIVIAHALNTIVDADQILVLDRGRVAEQGIHATLSGSEGLYAGLWRAQQQARGWQFRGRREPEARELPPTLG